LVWRRRIFELLLLLLSWVVVVVVVFLWRRRGWTGDWNEREVRIGRGKVAKGGREGGRAYGCTCWREEDFLFFLEEEEEEDLEDAEREREGLGAMVGWVGGCWVSWERVSVGRGKKGRIELRDLLLLFWNLFFFVHFSLK